MFQIFKKQQQKFPNLFAFILDTITQAQSVLCTLSGKLQPQSVKKAQNLCGQDTRLVPRSFMRVLVPLVQRCMCQTPTRGLLQCQPSVFLKGLIGLESLSTLCQSKENVLFFVVILIEMIYVVVFVLLVTMFENLEA